MAGRTLSVEEAQNLLKYKDNVENRYRERPPVFDKQSTISILNAVTENKTTTDNGEWTIKYFDNGERFSVKPGPKHRGPSRLVPCGNFITERVMERLEL
jgi:hypothetical protein